MKQLSGWSQQRVVLLLVSPENTLTNCHSFPVSEVLGMIQNWTPTKLIHIPESPMCVYPHIWELSTMPPVQHIGLCNPGAGVTRLRDTSASAPWVPQGEIIRSIVHTRPVRSVCGLWAHSLLRLPCVQQPVWLLLQPPANLCSESAHTRSACSALVLQNIAVTMLLDNKDPTPFS